MEQHLLIRYLLKILCHGRKDCPVLSLNQVKPLTKLLALSGWKIQGVDPVDWLLFQSRFCYFANPKTVQTCTDYLMIKSSNTKVYAPIGVAESRGKCTHRCSKSLWKKVFGSLSWTVSIKSVLRIHKSFFLLRFLCHVSWPRSRCNKSAFMNLLLLKFHLCTRVHCENKFSINISVIKVTACWRQMDHYNCNLYDLQLLRI